MRKPSDIEFLTSVRAGGQINFAIDIHYDFEKTNSSYHLAIGDLQDCLMIYYLASVEMKEHQIEILYSNSPLKYRSRNRSSYYPKYKRQVIKEDRMYLPKFLEELLHLVREIRKGVEEKDTFKYSLELALDHFRDCLLNYHMDWKKRITQIVMGLESIWLSENDKETIGFKLKIRSAKVLSLLDIDPEDIARNISTAYSIRSAYAHGSPINSKLRKKIQSGTIDKDALELEMLNYLRLSIVLALLLGSDSKTDFVSKLNKATYHSQFNDLLIKELKEKKKLIDDFLPIMVHQR